VYALANCFRQFLPHIKKAGAVKHFAHTPHLLHICPPKFLKVRRDSVKPFNQPITG
jgi:hypothetical protein